MTNLAKLIWSLLVLAGLFCFAVLAVGFLTHATAELFLAGWNAIT